MNHAQAAFNLRLATQSDVDALAGLVSELGYPTTAKQMRLRLQSILKDPDYTTIVVQVEKRVIGFVGTRLGPVYEADGLQGQIMALVVADGYRRMGIGRALMLAALEDLAARGAGNIIVNTGNQRAGAHAFYEALGFEFTGRRYRRVKGSGEEGL